MRRYIEQVKALADALEFYSVNPFALEIVASARAFLASEAEADEEAKRAYWATRGFAR